MNQLKWAEKQEWQPINKIIKPKWILLETSHVIIGNLGYLKSGTANGIISFCFKRKVSYESISFIGPSLTLLTILVIYSVRACTMENTHGVQDGFQNFLFPAHSFHSEFCVEFRQKTLNIFSFSFKIQNVASVSKDFCANIYMPWENERKSGHSGHRWRAKSYLFSLFQPMKEESSWQQKQTKAATFLLHPPPLVDPRAG